MAKNKKNFKVKATDTGFYGGRRIYEGTIFFLAEARAFSSRWMKDLTPERNLAETVRKAQRAERIAGKAAIKAKKSDKVVDDEVIEDEEPEDEESEGDESEDDNDGDDGSDSTDGSQGTDDESGDGEGEEESLIMGALQQLDHDEDKHWTQAGLPDVNTVAKILDDNEIQLTRVRLNQVAPDFKRDQGE